MSKGTSSRIPRQAVHGYLADMARQLAEFARANELPQAGSYFELARLALLRQEIQEKQLSTLGSRQRQAG